MFNLCELIDKALFGFYSPLRNSAVVGEKFRELENKFKNER
jgi:hypothetical protein